VYYSGGALLFTDTKQMKIMEAGLGHLKRIITPFALLLRQDVKTTTTDDEGLW